VTVLRKHEIQTDLIALCVCENCFSNFIVLAMIFFKLKNICYFLKLYKGNAKNTPCCCTNELYDQVPYNTINYTYTENGCYNLYIYIYKFHFFFLWELDVIEKQNSSSMCIFQLCTKLYFLAVNC
jgi:hypothetical protein